MQGPELYRFLIVSASGFTIALNLFVGFQWSKAWVRSRDQELRHALRGPAIYPLAAAATGAVSVYWRVNDSMNDLPLGVGDFTVLVPILGFMAAAWVSLGNFARVDNLMNELRRLEQKEP